MRRALESLAQPRHYPWLVVAISALVLLPFLGRHGFLEPREIEVADAAGRWLRQRASANQETRPVDLPDEEAAERTAGGLEEAAGPAAPGVSAEPGVPAEPGPLAEPGVPAEPGAAEPALSRQMRPRPKLSASAPEARAAMRPRFTERLVADGIDNFGFAEGAARAPLALFGLLAVVAAYLIGARVASRRAGLISAMVLLSFPLLVLQSRQLTSEIAPVTGSALLVLGLVGLALPSSWSTLGDGKAGWVRGAVLACDVAAVALGATIALAAAGPLLGLVPPLGGVGLGILFWYFCERRSAERTPPALYLLGLGAFALAASVAALAWFAHDVFRVVPAQDGDLELFGRTVQASGEILPGLGGAWKSHGDPQVPFTAVFEQIGFGVFPWVAIAPIAVARLALGRAETASTNAGSRLSWAGYGLFAWAALAWLVASIVTRKVGTVQYPAIVAIAAAIGIWIDELLAIRQSGANDEGAASHGAYPLLALFGLLAALAVGKDLMSSPDELTSLTATGVKYPKGAHLHWGIAPIVIAFASSLAAGLFLWGGPYRLRWRWRGGDPLAIAGRWGLHAAVVVGVLFGLFLAHVWIPGLAQRVSSRDVLELFRQRRQEGDELGLLGNLGSGPSYYAGTDYILLSGRAELISFLARPGRVFALTRATELCPLHKESLRRGFKYYVLDKRNVQFLLVSNQLRDGEVDQNPLARAIRRAPPDNIQTKLSANFDDQIELIGVNLPQRVSRGEKFEMTLFYKVLRPLSRPWKIFVHLNAPNAPSNINGDHDPVAAAGCSITSFQPGDYIVDTFEVRAGDSAFPKSEYRVFTGFFLGGSGNYTNMKALSGNPDEKDRVPVGTIQVR